MRAWVAKRREGGALLAEPIAFGATSAPYELLVVEVTDQGARRPTRVARLVPVGERVAVAQLVAPRLAWLGGWDMVLSGVEEGPGNGGVAGVAQSWICRLAPPLYATGFLARHMHKDGVALRKGAIFDRYGSSTKGRLTVASVHEEMLGRHTMRAELASIGQGSSLAGELVEVELAWMAEDRFALTGFHHQVAWEGRPARLVRQGWLCEYLMEEPEDNHPRRKNGELRNA